MIGLSSTHTRDVIEAIVNGLCDDDLDRIDAEIVRRRKLMEYPACPMCGEALAGTIHEHDGIAIGRVAEVE